MIYKICISKLDSIYKIISIWKEGIFSISLRSDPKNLGYYFSLEKFQWWKNSNKTLTEIFIQRWFIA